MRRSVAAAVGVAAGVGAAAATAALGYYPAGAVIVLSPGAGVAQRGDTP